jgi:hypothetical protein
MSTPRTFVIHRVTAVTLTVAVLVLLALGLGGLGPLDSLGGLTQHALAWFQNNTEVKVR